MAEIQKKYQVFVSSTFEDLQNERQEVIHALLELDCIPLGMELFPAANEDQWSLIKGVIDDCDYYMVIIGGRYGSLGPKGLSYTEMEYRYAMDKGKPIIAFLHKDPDKLPKNKTEKTIESQKKFDEFRVFAQQKMCKFWEDAKDLGSVVSRSLIMLQKRHPGVGWVKATLISSKDAEIEILRLKQEIEDLKKNSQYLIQPPVDSDKYAQGDEKILISYDFSSTDISGEEHPWDHTILLKWSEIFFWILPIMMDPASDTKIKLILSDFLYEKCRNKYKRDKDLKTQIVDNFEIKDNDYLTIIIQARALGLIVKVDKRKATDDDDNLWTLTPHGDHVMTQLRAIKKSS